MPRNSCLLVRPIKEQYEALARQWLVFEAEVAALLSGHAARIRQSLEISARPERPGCSSWEGLATEARRGIFGCQGARRPVSDQHIDIEPNQFFGQRREPFAHASHCRQLVSNAAFAASSVATRLSVRRPSGLLGKCNAQNHRR